MSIRNSPSRLGDRISKRARRLAVLAVAGLISGLLGSIGARIVLTQSGRLSISGDLGGPEVAGMAIGVAFAVIEPPRRLPKLEKIFMPALTLLAIAVSVFVVAPPASAQTPCDVTVTVNGRTTSLLATSPEAPLVIDLDQAATVQFTASAGAPVDGTVEVTVASATPFGFLVEPEGVVVYFDEVNGGTANGTLRVERSGPTGFVVSGDRFTTAVLPLGLVELAVAVDEIAGGETNAVCTETAWIRPVARPATNLTGLLGTAIFAIGVAGLAMVRVLRRRVPPPSPSQVAGAIVAPGLELVDILDEYGKALTEAAVVAGKQYTLRLTLSPSVGDRKRKEGKENRLVLFGRSAGVDIQPMLEIGIGGVPIGIPIPFVPRRTGRQEIQLVTLCNGQLMQRSTVELTVVERRGLRKMMPPSLSTTHYGSDLAGWDLDERARRDLLIVVSPAAEDAVDVQAFGERGGKTLTLNAQLPIQAVRTAADNARRHLYAALLDGADLDLSDTELRTALEPMVMAGRKLHMALFPPHTELGTCAGTVSDWVRDGGIVQVAQGGAGLGPATIPWALVYDRGFLPRGEGNRLCGTFRRHPVDNCPHANHPEVMCPSGFWGYRSVIEEPLIAVEGSLLSPPVALGGDRGVGYVEPKFAEAETQAAALRALGMRPVGGIDELRHELEDGAGRLGLLYLYARPGAHGHVAERGIVIGAEVLSSMSVDTLAPDWSRRPLVIVNLAGTISLPLADPFTVVDAFRRAGAAGIVTTECTLPEVQAGRLGSLVVEQVASGEGIGRVLLQLRRDLLHEHNNPIGFAYRLMALSETTLEPARERVASKAGAPA